jgi:Fe-S cluster assembly iron-binding protein IscA
VLSAIVIVGLVNHLAAGRLRWRRDFSSSGRFQLSPLTLQVLGGMTNDVKVTVLFPRDSDLFGHIDGLLREYSDLQPRIHTRFVDSDAEPVTAVQVRTSYKLGPEDANLVVFDAGGQVVRIAESELSTYDANINEMMAGRQREVRRSAFKGEALFTSALSNLASTNRVHACFLTGHDESRPDSEDRLTGYFRFAGILTAKSASVATIRLDGTNEVPADCQLLVIPGPTQPFLPVEVERITRFLDGGGRVLLALNEVNPTVRLGLDRVLFVPAATPPLDWVMGALRGTLAMEEYRRRYEACLTGLSFLAPGALRADTPPGWVDVQDGDTLVQNMGVKLLVDPMSFQYLSGAEIDYRESVEGSQFVIRNPNATTTCGCGSSFSA